MKLSLSPSLSLARHVLGNCCTCRVHWQLVMQRVDTMAYLSVCVCECAHIRHCRQLTLENLWSKARVIHHDITPWLARYTPLSLSLYGSTCLSLLSCSTCLSLSLSSLCSRINLTGRQCKRPLAPQSVERIPFA